MCFEKLISLSFMITPKRGLSNSRELSLTPLEFIGLSEAALERPGQLRQKAQKVDVTSGEVKRMAVMMGWRGKVRKIQGGAEGRANSRLTHSDVWRLDFIWVSLNSRPP